MLPELSITKIMSTGRDTPVATTDDCTHAVASVTLRCNVLSGRHWKVLGQLHGLYRTGPGLSIFGLATDRWRVYNGNWIRAVAQAGRTTGPKRQGQGQETNGRERHFVTRTNPADVSQGSRFPHGRCCHRGWSLANVRQSSPRYTTGIYRSAWPSGVPLGWNPGHNITGWGGYLLDKTGHMMNVLLVVLMYRGGAAQWWHRLWGKGRCRASSSMGATVARAGLRCARRQHLFAHVVMGAAGNIRMSLVFWTTWFPAGVLGRPPFWAALGHASDRTCAAGSAVANPPPSSTDPASVVVTCFRMGLRGATNFF